MKKSKILVISTILNAIIGIELIIVSGYVLLKLIPSLLGIFELDLETTLIFLGLPQLGATFGIIIAIIIATIIFILAIFELLTAWLSFKTNKKSFIITHIILLIIVSLIALFFSAFRPPIVSTFFANWFIFAVILRIIGYKKQKKIDE